MSELDGKNVLITGCGSGFGRALALTMARRGDRVMATVRDPAAAPGLRAEAEEEGLELAVGQLDVSDPASVERAVAEAESALGGIEVLVNNAAVPMRGPIETIADDELRDVLEVNLLGVLRMVRAVVPRMRERGGGVIVNVSSLAGRIGVPYDGAYAMSKFAVEALSEALIWEAEGAGIRVVVIEPGRFATSIEDKVRFPRAFGEDHPLRADFEEFWAALERTVLSGGPGDPQEVVDAICESIDDPASPRRRVVGADAEAILALRHEHPDEEFLRLMRATLGIPAGVATADAPAAEAT
jgi:NAD(P)-dependent dehydrogenase (short-subunit alcohol dehydrogenase family)